ncbi:MAG: serine--tRNA ligase [Gemmatimonadetes bacterium 13_1_40CM_70_11]|nr:MAG: serine--tRNA ligase [Gemmatimonadetes bacterium 13_1_40CM_70_11]
MIDLKLLRTSPDHVRAALARRGDPAVLMLLDELERLDAQRRELATALDDLNRKRNGWAHGDAAYVKQHGALPADVLAQRKEHGGRISQREQDLRNVESVLSAKALFIPNLPLPDVPDGDASAIVYVRAWGQPAPRGGAPHWQIAEHLGILDLQRGTKLSGSGFPVFVGAGARLVRALINFMLDLHTREHGYVEVAPPFVVRRETMQGTGQVPKFEDDAYRTEPDDLFLVPTAEVPVTNLLRDELLDGATLPRAYVAYTPCFRREAGAAGKDTRGLLRVHQFDKVELVRFCRPEDSPAQHEQLVGHAEEVLKRLELPYRVALMSTQELGFANAKQYDLEAWAPAVGAWLEVSSAFRPRPGEKPEFVHTLNASGVALPRTIAALLETRQQPDGSVTLPPALVPYMGSDHLSPAGAA